MTCPAGKDVVGDRVGDSLEGGWCDLVFADGAAPGNVPRVARLGSRGEQAATDGVDPVGEDDQVGARHAPRGELQRRAAFRVVEADALLAEVVAVPAEGLEQSAIQGVVGSEYCIAGADDDERSRESGRTSRD